MKYLLLLCLLIPTLLQATPWPNGVIPYYFSEFVPKYKKIEFVKATIEWETKVPFLMFFPSTAFDRTAVKVQWSGTGACNAIVGYYKTYNYMTLSTRCDMPILLHELGHTIGLFHEHQRSDRDSYIRMDMSPIILNSISQYEKRNDPIFGPYDFESIMHYGPFVIIGRHKQVVKRIIYRLDGVYGPPLPEHMRYITDKDIDKVYKLYVKKRN